MMKVTVTLGDINSRGRWEQFCNNRGWDYWCMSEGNASRDEEVTLEQGEAECLGFLPMTDVGREWSKAKALAAIDISDEALVGLLENVCAYISGHEDDSLGVSATVAALKSRMKGNQ